MPRSSPRDDAEYLLCYRCRVAGKHVLVAMDEIVFALVGINTTRLPHLFFLLHRTIIAEIH